MSQDAAQEQAALAEWQALLGGEALAPETPGAARDPIPPYPAWCRELLARSTVAANGRAFATLGTGPPPGRLTACRTLPGGSLLQAQYRGTPETFGVGLCRTVIALQDEYIALLDRLRGGKGARTRLEWQAHVRVALHETAPGAWESPTRPGLVVRLADPESIIPPHPGAPAIPPRLCCAQRDLADGEARYAAVLMPLGDGSEELAIRPLPLVPEPGDVVAGYEVERSGGRRDVLMVGCEVRAPFGVAGYRCEGKVAVVRRQGAWLQAALGVDTRYVGHRGRRLIEGDALAAFEVRWEARGVMATVHMAEAGQVRLFAPGAESAGVDGEPAEARAEGQSLALVIPPGRHELALQ